MNSQSEAVCQPLGDTPLVSKLLLLICSGAPDVAIEGFEPSNPENFNLENMNLAFSPGNESS